MRKRKIFGKTGTISLLVAALGMVVSPTAAAFDNSGGLGGGAGGGTVSSAYWVSATGSNAYEVFKSRSGQGNTFESKLQRSGADINICKRSNVIWWVQASGGFWVHNWTGATHGPRTSVGASIEGPYSVSGRPPTGSEVNQFLTWDYWSNGHKVDSRPGYTVICGGAFLKQDEWRKYTQDRETRDEEHYEIAHNYAIISTVTPRKIDGQYPGGGEYESQTNVTKTNFGKLYDSLANGTSLSPEQVKQQVEEAVSKDRSSLIDSSVGLSDKNKAAFAKGGILDVSQFQQKATLSVSRTTRHWQQRDCWDKRTWNSYWGTWNAWENTSCSEWHNVYDNIGATGVTKTNQTPQKISFFQMISVHCNKDAFDALVNATGSEVYSEGNAEKGISAVAKSPEQYKGRWLTHADFGDAQNPNQAAADSAHMGFFDKECPFDCTSSSGKSDGASDKNDAVNNKGTSGTSSNGGLNGAQSESISTNSFEMFRDNKMRDIRIDTWYPKSDNVVHYNGEAPKTTTISRWSEGTPDITGKNGGKFTMLATKGTQDQTGKQLFGGGSSPAANQRNWDKGLFSNSTASLIDGFYNNFKVGASWASEEGRPQVLNVKWEYAPEVSTRIPERLGFEASGDGSKWNEVYRKSVEKTAPIEGKCYANFGTEQSGGTKDLFRDNTGTGTTNSIDGRIIGGTDNPSTVSTNVVINFVRSTTE